MNYLKSVFIFISPILLIIVVTQGILLWADAKNTILSLGIALSAMPLLVFLSYIMLFRKLARTDRHLLAVSIPSIMGVFLVLLDSMNGFQTWPFAIAVSGWLITQIYIYWYSDNARQNSEGIVKGKMLPQFTVKDTDGIVVDSESFLHKKSLIFFYRGNWCPLCMAQIDEVVSHYKKFEDNDIDVIFIAPQSAKNTRKLAEKFNLSFKFYTDQGNKAVKKLGILHKYGLPMGFQVLGYETDSVYPTIIALDDSGNIIYSDQTTNYRVRPEPEEILKIFEI